MYADALGTIIPSCWVLSLSHLIISKTQKNTFRHILVQFKNKNWTNLANDHNLIPSQPKGSNWTVYSFFKWRCVGEQTQSNDKIVIHAFSDVFSFFFFFLLFLHCGFFFFTLFLSRISSPAYVSTCITHASSHLFFHKNLQFRFIFALFCL